MRNWPIASVIPHSVVAMISLASTPKAAPSLWRVICSFWPYIRQQWRLLSVASISLLADVGLRILEPWPLKVIFDDVLIPAQGSSALSAVPEAPTAFSRIFSLDPVWLLTGSAIAIITLTGLRAIAAYWSTVSLAILGSRVMRQVRNQLYRHLQSLSLKYHSTARSGDLIVRVSSDASRLEEILLTAGLPLVVSILTLTGMISVMAWLDLKLTLLSLTTLPLFGFASKRLSRRIRAASLRQRQREGDVAATAAESLSAIKLVKALSLENAFADLFDQQNHRSLEGSVATKRLSAHLERTVDVLIALGTAIVLWYGAWLVIQDTLSSGDVLVFLTYLKSAFKPVQKFAKYTGRLSKAAASGERILNILEQVPAVRNLPNALPAPSLKGAVELENLHFAYTPGCDVLKGINLSVAPGQRIAIVGPSGSGKSTLTSLLLRLYDPTEGRVMIDGHDLRALTLESLRPQVSVVLQDSLLFAASIRENIAYGMAGVTGQEIRAAAQLANAHEFIRALPNGYDTIVGERGGTLSGGQRQRIAIARVAIRSAPILILDEPTTGLDNASEKAVSEALQQLSQGRTTFLITHDLHLSVQADKILYLEHGQLIEQGTHAELMAKQGAYATLFQMQSAVRDHAIAIPS